MLASSYATGFALGFSLLLAIGAQNAFVLRQGLLPVSYTHLTLPTSNDV